MGDFQHTQIKKGQHSNTKFEASSLQSRSSLVQTQSQQSSPVTQAELRENYQRARQLGHQGENIPLHPALCQEEVQQQAIESGEITEEKKKEVQIKEGGSRQRLPFDSLTEQTAERGEILAKGDRDLIRYAIDHRSVWAVKNIENYGAANSKEKYNLIEILVSQWWAGPFDEVALLKIWKSFGSGKEIIEAASTKRGLDLWKKSVEKGARLDFLPQIIVFIFAFEVQAKKQAQLMLDESKKRVDEVCNRYGITEKQVQESKIVETGRESGQLWTRETIVHTKYEMPESSASKEVAIAASELLEKRSEINRLETEQNKFKETVCKTVMREDICYPRIINQSAYNELDKKIRDAKIAYNKLLNEKVGKFPELAPVGTNKDSRLATIAKGQPNQIAQIIGPIIKEVLDNIQVASKGLKDDKLSVWHLPPVIALTKQKMNLKQGGLWDVLVDQKKAQVEEDDESIKAMLSIAAGVLAIAAAIPSGGSSLALLGTGAALGTSLVISGGLLAHEIEQYSLQEAANATDFVQAKAISNQEPSLFWLAIDLISFGLDIFGAAKVFKALTATATTATLVSKVGGEGSEVALKEADEAVESLRKAGNDAADGLGDQLAQDAVEARGLTSIPDSSLTPSTKIDWNKLIKITENPSPRVSQKGFRSQSFRSGNYEVVIVEGRVGTPIPQTESSAKYVSKVKGEHGTHSVGMQLGENLHEGIKSAPSQLNLSELKVFENTTRETADIAKSVGVYVETKTITMVEYQGEIPKLVGVQREAWIIIPGTDKDLTFARIKVEIDPLTRKPTIIENWSMRPNLQ